MKHSTGGVASTSQVIWTGDPPPNYPHCWPRETTAAPHTRPLSIQEQMGTDPISKLAAAIEKLADAINGEGQADA